MISSTNSNTGGYLVKRSFLTSKRHPERCEPGALLLLGADTAGNFFLEVGPVAHGLVAELDKPGLQSHADSLRRSISLLMVSRCDAPPDPTGLAEFVVDLWEINK